MEETLALIKPDAVKRNIIGNIVSLIEKNGFTIKKMKMIKMSDVLAKNFYSVHEGKPFFDELIKYMTSDNIVAIVLQRDNAVIAYRKLIGATNPKDAEENTIRKLYALNQSQNSVHGSDSIENAQSEISILFDD